MRNTRLDWLIFVVFVALAAHKCHAQETNICGIDQTQPQPGISRLSVACVDFDKLRAIAPSVAWPRKPQTQVLIHAEQPGAVRVTVGETEKWAELLRDSEGRWVALVPFDGIEHAVYSATAYRAIDAMPPVSTAAPARAAITMQARRLNPSADGSYPLAVANISIITANGLVMEEGRDYGVKDGRLIPFYEWPKDWLIIQRGISSQ